MRLRTRLTERFDIEHPIISEPMGMVAGGRLAAVVSNASWLGLIGGGVFVGEAAGLIHDVRPAAHIIEQMVAQAHGLLRHAGQFILSG